MDQSPSSILLLCFLRLSRVALASASESEESSSLRDGACTIGKDLRSTSPLFVTGLLLYKRYSFL